MTTERSNYAAWVRRPGAAIPAATKLLVRAGWSAVGRYLPGALRLLQPSDVRRARLAFMRSAGGPASDAGLAGSATVWEERPPCQLTLAIGSCAVRGEPDWHTPFDDVEVRVSLHRWNWLLRGVTDDAETLSREQGLNLMRSWIRACVADERFGHDAYSAGERIVNACLFLWRDGGQIPQDIQQVIAHMARQVTTHLEYYPDGQTGNHAFNNARALWFAGVATGQQEAIDLASAIARERLAGLVTRDGFLQEGSSHYHFLFTRWVLELLWLSERTGDKGLRALVLPFAAQLVERCWFFLVFEPGAGTWRIPLMGDVSPDFPPDWLLSVPWSALACRAFRPARLPRRPTGRGWADLFGVVEGEGGESPASTEAHTAGGWYRIEHRPWTMFLRAVSSDGRLRAGHQHHDVTGYALFQLGEPVLVDCGRLDYTGEPLGTYGRSAAAHNSILVNGLGPSADGPAWLADRYAALQLTVTIESQDDQTVVVLVHDGFARVRPEPVAHRREWRLSSTQLQVVDTLAGRGACDVSVRCHWAPHLSLRSVSSHEWYLDDSALVYACTGLPETTLHVGHAETPIGGFCFPAYGSREVCSTLESRGHCDLPVTCTYTLRKT